MKMTKEQRLISRKHLLRLCQELGSAYKLGKLININSYAVYEWLDGIRDIPVLRAFDIDLATEGRYCVGNLRPDIRDKYKIHILYQKPA